MSTRIQKRRSIDEVKLYIEELQLAKADDAPPADPPPAAVDAGSQVSFVSNLQGQPRWDTLNSTLLAQLHADAATKLTGGRYGDPKGWYDSYTSVLGNVGWDIQSFEFTQYEASGESFEVDTAILEVLASIASEDEIAVVSATLGAVQANSLGEAATLWNAQTHSANQGNFQVGVASDSNGVTVMKLGVFYFTTSDTVTSILGFKFESSSTQFMKAAQVVNLDEEVYSQVRSTVLEKLGANAQKFVADLDI